MGRRIVINFEHDTTDPTFYKVWLFGEALYGELKHDRWGHVSLDEVDSASERLCVSVRSKQGVSRVLKVIDDLLKAHFLERRASISVEATAE